MSKTLIALVVIVILAAGGWYFYTTPVVVEAGEYAYQCENGSQFSMTPSESMAEVTLYAGSQGMFTGAVTVHKMGDGNHYEGGNIVFGGAGEEVSLTVGNESTVCNPVPNAEMAPWNWGDAGEGGGTQQDVELIVSESIVGKWKSADDAKFVREFKAGGTVSDWYDGKVVSSGSVKVFTSVNPFAVAFPLEMGVVYVQLVMGGTQAQTLNFKLNRLTPEELEFTYMDRGGVLRFVAVN